MVFCIGEGIGMICMLLKIVLGGEMWNYFNKLVRDMKLF